MNAAPIETPEQLYGQFRPMMLKIAWKILRNPEDVEDCVQEAMIRVIEHWTEARPGTVSQWAHSIVRNQALTMLRRRKSRRQEQHVPVDDVSLPVRSHAEAVLVKVEFERALAKLPERSARAVRLRLHYQCMDIQAEFPKIVQFRAFGQMRAAFCGMPLSSGVARAGGPRDYSVRWARSAGAESAASANTVRA